MPRQNDKRGIIHFSASLLRRYPFRSCLILAGFLVAGILEGLSAGSLLPLLGKLNMGASAAAAVPTSSMVLTFFDDMFLRLHLEQTVGSLLALIIALFFIKAVLQFFAMQQVGNGTASMAAELRRDLIAGLMNARWSYFTSLSTGQIINTLITEADRAALSYLHLCKLLADTIIVLVYLVIAVMISWKVTLAAVLGGAFLMMLLHRLVYVVKQAGQAQTHLLRTLASVIADTLASFKPIKAMGREAFFHRILTKDTKDLWRAKKKEVMGTELMSVARDPLLISLVAAGLYAAYTYAALTLPVLLVLAFMFLRVVQKLTAVQVSYQRVATQESAYWSIKDATRRAQETRETFAGAKGPELRKAIRFENVEFSHRREGGALEPVLRGVSCAFPANTLTTISGPSGAGKTTLADLVLGFYRPDSGKIFLDETPLQEIDIKAWRERVGYVPQDCVLFFDTVQNNITLGDEGITEEAVVKALKAADAWDFVKALPKGMQESVGEKGLMLSGGQKQRIAIARAIVKNPLLLLLDEPTSALDKNSEKAIMETIKHLSETMTVIMISHSIRAQGVAHETLVLDDGRLVSGMKV